MQKSVFLAAMVLLTGFGSVGQRPFVSPEEFQNPPLNCYPKPLWFWNDTLVTRKGIEQQMQNFRDSSSYSGFGILPFGKHFKPEYLSESYFDVYKTGLEQAKKLGLTMCLYDEFGFPSGGVGATNGDGINRFKLKFPDQTIKRLDKKELEVKGNSILHETIPDGKLMAAVAMEKSTFERINLRKFIEGKSLNWKVPEGAWKVLFFVCVENESPIVDYLDPAATRNFIQMTHEAYFKRFREYFGTVITGTFFDEPTMYRAEGRIWTPLFNEKFKLKYGFTPDLYYPALWYDIGPETRVARNYLFGFRTELYAKGFTKEVNDWSVAHGITATGHQDQEEVLNPVSVSGDLMKCFKYLEIPGIDKIGGDRPAERFYKVVSSAANNWDKPLVMSETYGAMGNISWNEIFSVAMDQYAKGINMLIPHAVWYNVRNVVFKPELSYRNPIYADSLKIFNQFLGRLNLILQKAGRHKADIAVLYPIHTLQGEHHLDGPLPPYKGGVASPRTDYIDVANWLTEEAGKDFTFLHPEVFDEKCTVTGAKLHLQNKINREDFSVLILPSCKTISLSNLKKVREFYEQGGNIIFTSQLPEFATEPDQDMRVKELIKSMFPSKDGKETCLAISSGNGRALYIPEPDGMKIRSALQELKLNFDVDYSYSKNLRYVHKIIDGHDIYYFANTGSDKISAELKLNGKHALGTFDPHSGKRLKTELSTDERNGLFVTKIVLNLEPFRSLFLISG